MCCKCNRWLLLALIAMFGVALFAHAQQAMGMQKMDMNDMPYAKVKAMLSNPSMKMNAMKMAKMNHVLLMAGMPVEGEKVNWTGELTGANCYLSQGLHGHNHAMCAKACVAAGSPIVFIHGNHVYTVLTATDGMPLPEAAYDDLGVSGVTVQGTIVRRHGSDAIAVMSVSR